MAHDYMLYGSKTSHGFASVRYNSKANICIGHCLYLSSPILISWSKAQVLQHPNWQPEIEISTNKADAVHWAMLTKTGAV